MPSPTQKRGRWKAPRRKLSAEGEDKYAPISEPLTVLKRIAERGTIIWDFEREGVRRGETIARLR